MIQTPLLSGLAPVLDARTRILILGSFPGNASLAAGQYYAHPRNHFWPLLSAVLDEDLVGLPYAQRLARLLAHGVGLWDVLAACAREGSLDSAIRQAQANQFDLLHERCPQLRKACFNGKTSGKFAPRFAAAGFDTLVLPSSSPANARSSFGQKLAEWRNILL
ncbi:DNA-deoxyinosine glycosylase [Noviherbaspirillum aridicola]|uniref:DNA-deoxyinosine glycosylase n=1 Tax=Noviherbaspirillum aridicola TaxID=2849687 RepID=A0ABQ4Q4F7_9BURK|nr:DNA-deoxyinosine glycosylase [Noviherbaspirillum aridicola]GIZ52077.1 DNA-deoxyinosine glycosylase [Noviherbaspirillum aridicola]